MLENQSTTTLENIGEFGLIDLLTSSIKIHHSSTQKGVGDDAAVIDHGNLKTLISTDLLLEGIHFDLSYFPLKHLGYKAITSNLSDIYAMNAMPKQVTVSIGISSKFTLEAVEELYAGMLFACNRYEVDLVGGDTSSSKQGLVISVTAIGEAEADDIVYRNGAKPGDLLCVTGDLGAAYTGFQLLEREKRVYLANPEIQPDLEGKDYIIERQLKPEARKDIVLMLKHLNIKPTSMIDISDGLSSEIFHLCANAKTGMYLYEDKIPIDPTSYNMARELDIDPTLTALSGGEDYELLFTIAQSEYEKIKDNADITVIGYVCEEKEGIHMISKSGNKHPLKAQGWKAF
ncbi:MAG: thiamine-phosphate kinase [Bacteroidia bacterium]|jgi:thiamine-monophosphate kinase|nr:thiamine-phosphate kinase [Bacteroidia bacterium]